jgi:hypothetical protein
MPDNHGYEKVYVTNDNYLQSMMTLRNYVTYVVRCDLLRVDWLEDTQLGYDWR